MRHSRFAVLVLALLSLAATSLLAAPASAQEWSAYDGVVDDQPASSSTVSSSLSLTGTDGATKITVTEANSVQSSTSRTLLELVNNGKLDFRVTDSSRNNTWKFEIDPLGYFISLDGSGQTEMALLENGNMIIAGTLTEQSDVTRKEGIEAIDPQTILDTTLALPISTWSYRDDASGARHIGPMAQDVFAAFGYGGTATGVQARNLSSIALASIQGLDAKVAAELEAKQQRIDELEARLTALEALLAASDD